jgi:hypothetical protein
MPVQRRARDRDGSIIQPMTLANMRENGLRRIRPAKPASMKRCSRRPFAGGAITAETVEGSLGPLTGQIGIDPQDPIEGMLSAQ